MTDREPLRHLVIHAGDQKCGSTTIQHAILERRMTYDGTPVAMFNGQFNDGDVAVQAQEGYIAQRMESVRLCAIARHLGPPCRVLSSELFETLDPAEFDRTIAGPLSENAESRTVIAYARPHGPRIISQFSEMTKVGWTFGDLDEFFERARDDIFMNLRYHERFSRWRDVFGDDLVVRPLVPGQLVNGDVLDDFAQHALDGLGAVIRATNPKANQRLGLKDLMAVKQFQTSFRAFPEHVRTELGWTYDAFLAPIPKTVPRTTLRMSRRLAERVVHLYLDDAREFDRDFWNGEPIFETELQRLVEDAPATSMSVEPSDYLDRDQFHEIDAITHFVRDLIGNEALDTAHMLNLDRLLQLMDSAEGAVEPTQSTPVP